MILFTLRQFVESALLASFLGCFRAQPRSRLNAEQLLQLLCTEPVPAFCSISFLSPPGRFLTSGGAQLFHLFMTKCIHGRPKISLPVCFSFCANVLKCGIIGRSTSSFCDRRAFIMALDGIVTRAIVHELQPFIGARVGKIYQPSTHDLIFILRGAEAAASCCCLRTRPIPACT